MARTATHKPRTNKDKVTELHLATYNVRTLFDECHIVSLENEIVKIKLDIIGISEMRRSGENVVELASQHIMFNKGNDKRQDKSPLLVSYLFSIGDPRHPSPLCPLCLMHDHTSSHLFECKSLPTSLSSLDLWTNPDKVEPFLATWGGRLLAAT